MRKLEDQVRKKDAQGFYDTYSRPGYTLNFMDKIYIESTILFDMVNEQKNAEKKAFKMAQQEELKVEEVQEVEEVQVVIPEIIPV